MDGTLFRNRRALRRIVRRVTRTHHIVLFAPIMIASTRHDCATARHIASAATRRLPARARRRCPPKPRAMAARTLARASATRARRARRLLARARRRVEKTSSRRTNLTSSPAEARARFDACSSRTTDVRVSCDDPRPWRHRSSRLGDAHARDARRRGDERTPRSIERGGRKRSPRDERSARVGANGSKHNQCLTDESLARLIDRSWRG